MNKSINHLPQNKQNDLNLLCDLIRTEIKHVVMVILYGSYARGSYVDYDQRKDYGIPTYFMSDYDILIITRKPIGAIKDALYSKIKQRFFQNKNRPYYTKPHFINAGIEDFNKAIRLCHFFETDIKNEGIILYDSGEFKLADEGTLNFSEIKQLATQFYNKKFVTFGEEFLNLALDSYNRGNYSAAAFNLHQAAESFLRTIRLVFTLHDDREHDLADLLDDCKQHSTEIFKPFPRDTPEDQRLFDLLQESYIQSRYSLDFVVTKTDVDILRPKIEMLREITEKACRRRFAYYDQKIKVDPTTIR